MNKMSIRYLNYDTIFSNAFSIFEGRTLDFFGVCLPPIQRALDGKDAGEEIETDRFAPLFELADGSILHLEEEAELSEQALLRFARRDLALYGHTQKKITTVVLYPGKDAAARNPIDAGSLRYEILLCDTSKLSADALLQKARAEGAENVNPLELVFLPLARGGKPKGTLLEETVKTVARAKMDAAKKQKIIAAALAACNRFIDRETLETLWEEICMYQFIEFAEQKGMEKGLAQGMEQGLKKGVEQGAQRAKIQILARQLVKKFKYVPEPYMQKLTALNGIQVEFILDDIFEIRELSDLDKYLGEQD